MYKNVTGKVCDIQDSIYIQDSLYIHMIEEWNIYITTKHVSFPSIYNYLLQRQSTSLCNVSLTDKSYCLSSIHNYTSACINCNKQLQQLSSYRKQKSLQAVVIICLILVLGLTLLPLISLNTLSNNLQLANIGHTSVYYISSVSL